MSKASDLVAEVKSKLGKVERGLAKVEKDMVVGAYTDLAHLNIASIHLSEFLGRLDHHRSAGEQSQVAPVGSAAGPVELVSEAPAEPEPAAEMPQEPAAVESDPAAQFVARPADKDAPAA